MSILIDSVRIYGLRGLENIEVTLEPLTVLTGMNNTGKTSFLKALQIVLGNRQFISPDDFYLSENQKVNEIIVDIRIIPINKIGERINDFTDIWLEVFTDDRIVINTLGEQFIPLRTIVKIDPLTNAPKAKQYILKDWGAFENGEGECWYHAENGSEKPYHFDETPFFYLDAKRDIIEDLKLRNSYLGKMLSIIEYAPEDIESIEKQIKELNEHAVTSSDILSNIAANLKDLDTAMDNENNGVDITPFPKKVRDLNRGVSIQYSEFSMDYHGMGTRSWSSFLTLKSFISFFYKNSKKKEKPFCPITTIEEPEAHLHPNAQKKLFGQISDVYGQKIVSTHSPYVAGSADLKQIRSFYKKGNKVICGKINTTDFSKEDIRKIKRQVINTRGELFFSKIIVLFEGETEEQALPIYAQKYFDKTSVELGIDFIGVGGHGSYLPFMRVAESLNIPWCIFSDAETKEGQNVKESVQKQLRDLNSSNAESDCIVFLNDGNNFEKQLIIDGFSNEIKQAIINSIVFQNEHHKIAKSKEINDYSDDKIYEIITNNKTMYGPVIAYAIIESGKKLPPKIIDLFDLIKKVL
ncbi:MAG: AAA family ATPase [Ignavibacteriae bacterium]|nr:AAA family ATPase [Ignavibacteriota bacterium]